MSKRSAITRATIGVWLSCAALPAGAVLSGSVSGADAVVSFSLPYGDGSVRIPLAGNVQGHARGEVAAGSTGVSALLTEATPSAGPGVILNAGPPPVGASVGYGLTTKTHSNALGGATATSSATIKATPSGPGGGVINQVTVVGVTPTTASTSGFAFALGTANVDTDPVVLTPLSAAQTVTLIVDLFATGDTASVGGLRLSASGSGDAESFAALGVRATTNLPGLAVLFDMRLTARHDSSAVGVAFSSPLIAAPLAAADFVDLGGGVHSLKADKSVFVVPFTIPSGSLGTLAGYGTVGLVLDVFLDSTAQAVAVPEPGTAGLLLAGLAACGWRLRRRARSTACLLLALPAVAFAQAQEKGVSGDMAGIGATPVAGNNATEAFFVHAQRQGFAANVRSGGLRFDSTVAPPTPFALAPTNVCISTPNEPANAACPGGSGYFPTAGVKMQKPFFPPVLTDGASANSDAAGAASFLFGVASFITNNPVIGRGRPTISAGGFRTADKPVGTAAGAAFDPFDVDPGSYAGYQYAVHSVLNLDDGASGGLYYFALDSRASGSRSAVDNYYERGQPRGEALWWLAIAASGPLNSSNALSVDFGYRPSLLTLLQPDGSTPYTGEQIRSTLEQRLRAGIAGAQLDINFDLFPSPANPWLPGSTHYGVTLGADGLPISYAIGMNAGIVAVPEPPVWLLAGGGALMLALRLRRLGRTARGAVDQN